MTELSIHQRIALVMKDVGYVQKDKVVRDKNGKEIYRVTSHDTVIRVIRPSLIKHGILAVPKVVRHERIGSNLTTADLEIDFINVEKPQDKITVTYFGYGIDSGDKGPGKAISYAVRYAYLKVLSLETGDDPENDPSEFEEEKISEEEYINLREICESKNFPIDKTLSRLAIKIFQKKTIQDITKTELEAAKKHLIEAKANEPK